MFYFGYGGEASVTRRNVLLAGACGQESKVLLSCAALRGVDSTFLVRVSGEKVSLDNYFSFRVREVRKPIQNILRKIARQILCVLISKTLNK